MTSVFFYRDQDGTVPVLGWLDHLTEKAKLVCLARIELLREFGHELRRPHAEYLRDGIYELRAKVHGVNYRLLYFFYGRGVIILSHGITKQQAEVPSGEIDRAKLRKEAFEKNPQRHIFKE